MGKLGHAKHQKVHGNIRQEYTFSDSETESSDEETKEEGLRKQRRLEKLEKRKRYTDYLRTIRIFDSDLSEDEDESEVNEHWTNVPDLPLYEPCIFGTERVSLPTSLFSLQDLSSIFNMDTWNNVLNESDRQQLTALLPESKEGHSKIVERLFSGENYFFGNPVDRFHENLKSGNYNAAVVKHRERVQHLEKQNHLHALRVHHNEMMDRCLEAREKLGLPVEDKRAHEFLHAGNPNTGEPQRPMHADHVSLHPLDSTDSESESEDSESSSEYLYKKAKIAAKAHQRRLHRKEKEAQVPPVPVPAPVPVSNGIVNSNATNGPKKKEDKPKKVRADKEYHYVSRKETKAEQDITPAFLLFGSIRKIFNTRPVLTVQGIVQALQSSYGQYLRQIPPPYDIVRFISIALQFLAAPPPISPNSGTVEPLVVENGGQWKWISGNCTEDQLASLEQLFYFAITRTAANADDLVNVIKKNIIARQQKCVLTVPVYDGTDQSYHDQERERYKVPEKPFTYRVDGVQCVVAPLKRVGNSASNRPREHFLLKTDRPPHVNLLCLVRDAASRLPGGVGTRPDVAMLLRHSQFIVEGVSDNQMNTVVSGALDRLHSEEDPCVKYDQEQKLWIYLHRYRTESDFENYLVKKKAKKTAKPKPPQPQQSFPPQPLQLPMQPLQPQLQAPFSTQFQPPFQQALPHSLPLPLPHSQHIGVDHLMLQGSPHALPASLQPSFPLSQVPRHLSQPTQIMQPTQPPSMQPQSQQQSQQQTQQSPGQPTHLVPTIS